MDPFQIGNPLQGMAATSTLSARDNSSSSNPQDASPTASSLVSTLVPTLVSSAVMMLLFIVLRRIEPRQYFPRSYIGSLKESERTPPPSRGFFAWIMSMAKLPDIFVLRHHSMDAYFLLRYLKIVTSICFVGCLLTWPILFPVNATGSAGLKQMDKLSFSNVAKQPTRYYAHALMAWMFVPFVFYMVARELIYFINLRQAYFLSPLYSARVSSRTVLFTSVPDELLSEAAIRHIYGDDRVRHVWLVTNTAELDDLVEDRMDAAMKLEGAETQLIRAANKARLDGIKKQAKENQAREKKGLPPMYSGPPDSSAPNGDPTLYDEEENTGDDASGSVAAKWLDPKKRPTHRSFPLFGKKLDTINWARDEIKELTPKIDEMQAHHKVGDAPLVRAVFVEFHSQSDAQAAFQMVAHNQPLHMAPRYIGLTPSAIIWSNLRIRWWELILRHYATIAIFITMVVFWAIPVAFVGSISNVDYLTQKIHWLGWINDIPNWILGVVTGLLPSVLLAVLMALLPIVLRFLSQLGGVPTTAAVELRTQAFYFVFQVVQVFLVTTLSSAASAVVPEIVNQPTKAATLLAQNLPKAANFYISYFILQGLTFSAGAFLQISSLVLGKLLGTFLDNTPRKMYERWSSLTGLGWGTIFPIFTNLAVIAVTYACIAPLVMGFACVGLYLFYLAYRYDVLYVSDTNIDTKGMIYPRALQQTTTGCYLLLVCLLGLFVIETAHSSAAVGPLVLVIILLVFVIIFHISMNAAMDPLINYLPKILEHEEQSFMNEAQAEERKPLCAKDTSEIGSQKKKDHYEVRELPESDEKQDHQQQQQQQQQRESQQSTVNTASAPSTPASDEVDDSEQDFNIGVTTAATTTKSALFKFFQPYKYYSFEQLRRLVPRARFADVQYTKEVEDAAYLHPSVNAEAPLLWVPRDPVGISAQEVRHTSKVIDITDEDAELDEKNRIRWDVDTGRPPIYKEKIYY